MCAMLLMEDRDFKIPVRSLCESELHAQVAWFRSWLRSSGFQTPEDFLADQLAKQASLDGRIIKVEKEMEPMYEVLHILMASYQTINKTLQDAVDKMTSAAAEIRTHQGMSKKKNNLYMQFQFGRDILKLEHDQLYEAGKACEEQSLMMEPYHFNMDCLTQSRQVTVEVSEKLRRMQSLEAEFKSRNFAAKSAADYHAWSTGTESIYKEPVLPDYTHSDAIFEGQDLVGAEDFVPELDGTFDAWSW